jgi:hypothetical protein
VIPAQVAGSRVEDDADLRFRLVVLARVAAGSAASVLAAGFVLVALDHGSSSTASQVSAAPSATPSPFTGGTKDAGGAAEPTPTGTLTSPVVWRVQPTGDRRKDAAIAGYKNYLGTAVRLGETPDPADPALAQVAMDPELSRFRRALSVSSDADLSRRGRVLATARVMSLNGSQAVVIGCTDSSAQRLLDGQLRRQAWRGGAVVTAVHLRLQAGHWRVYQLNLMAPARCLN